MELWDMGQGTGTSSEFILRLASSKVPFHGF